MAINSARLKIPTPVNYAILGTWGQGKTSLLYKFRQMVIEDLQKEIKCACIYFALSPESCQNWERFTSDFLEDISSTLTSTSKITKKIRAELGKWEVSLNLVVVGTTRKRDERKPRFLEAMQLLWEKHLAPSGTRVPNREEAADRDCEEGRQVRLSWCLQRIQGGFEAFCETSRRGVVDT